MRSRTTELVRLLVTVAVGRRHPARLEQLRGELPSIDGQGWRQALVRLDEHRLLALVHHGLSESGLFDVVPDYVRHTLQEQFTYADAINRLRWLSLLGLAARLSQSNIVPTVCKGIVLAQRYYPHPATRHMNDVDLWIDASERAMTRAELVRLGFKEQVDKANEDASCFTNEWGLMFDVHHRMRLFERSSLSRDALVEPFESQLLAAHRPHVLLAHLLVHAQEHARSTGPMLCWLLDLGFVLKKEEPRLDAARLQAWISQFGRWRSLVHIARFLHETFDMDVPAQFLGSAEEGAVVSLDAVLRQRRLALWGLPRPRGWLRLLASAVRRRTPLDRPWPTSGELVHWPLDLIAHRALD